LNHPAPPHTSTLSLHDALPIWIDGVRGDGAHDERVAIRRALRDEVGADVAAGAGLVLDHHGLAERLLQLRRNQARGEVHRTSGRSEEHTSELQSLAYLVCRLLL